MSIDVLPVSKWFQLKTMAASLILIVNAFVWYMYAFNILVGIVRALELAFSEVLAMWVVSFTVTAIFALTGAVIANKIGKRISFLLVWMLVGVISSSIPMLLDTSVKMNLFLIVFLFGASFGLGTPSAMAYFADSTRIENRAKLGGLIFFTIGLGAFVLGTIDVADVMAKLSILTLWRGIGLATFLLVNPAKTSLEKNESHSYKYILSQRSFLLYYIPWIMFCLVNQTSAPIIIRYFGEDFATLMAAIEGTLSGTFAVISGIFCDKIGRRRVTMLGFITLGVGYATLGIFPEAVASMYFYTVADGIAWGVFYTVFFTTLWGDLSDNSASDKYYAIGGLPYLLSNFLRFVLGPYIAETISLYTIFSLASFFLFLAVIPLMYAPETLPEKRIKERELKHYIEKAKKVKEKYA